MKQKNEKAPPVTIAVKNVTEELPERVEYSLIELAAELAKDIANPNVEAIIPLTTEELVPVRFFSGLFDKNSFQIFQTC